jgi:DNA repair exonuclease SbcCD ATPase subunit
MGRPGIAKEQVFDAADALSREGQAPTVVAVRTRLGGGSPNNITRWLSEWKELHEAEKPEALPPLPEAVESAMRQVWGAAWKGSQEQLEAEREALATARKDIEKERAEMLSEIERLDGDLETARTENQRMLDSLDAERRAHDQTKAEVREARTLADERSKRIEAQDNELRDIRRQLSEASARVSRLEAEIAHAREDLETARANAWQEADTRAEAERKLALSVREVDGLKRDLSEEIQTRERAEVDLQRVQSAAEDLRKTQGDLVAEKDRALADNERLAADLANARRQLKEEKQIIDAGGKKIAKLEATLEEERQARAAAEKALAELRVEAATLTERAAHVDELRAMLEQLTSTAPRWTTAGKKAQPKSDDAGGGEVG